MKITCLKSDLIKAISTVQKAVPGKTTMTILNCFLLDATTGQIYLTATDTDLGIRTAVEGDIQERGLIALEARLLADIIRKLPESQVCISSDSSFQTIITCGSARFSIMGRDGDEFPALPYIEKNHLLTVSSFSLKEIILQTIFSISANDSNKIMTGELLEVKEDTLTMTSLDGHRISMRKLPLAQETEPCKVIIPGKTLSEIAKILSGELDDPVDLYFSQNYVLFEFAQTILVSRLIEGNYFRVEQMLSNDYDTCVTVNRQNLLECLDRSTLFVRDEDKKPIIMDIGDKSMQLRISSQLGTMDEELEITMEGKDIRIGFNPKFLLDALRVIDEEEVSIYYMNPKAPCVIRNAESTYVYLILPVNFVG